MGLLQHGGRSRGREGEGEGGKDSNGLGSSLETLFTPSSCIVYVPFSR